MQTLLPIDIETAENVTAHPKPTFANVRAPARGIRVHLSTGETLLGLKDPGGETHFGTEHELQRYYVTSTQSPIAPPDALDALRALLNLPSPAPDPDSGLQFARETLEASGWKPAPDSRLTHDPETRETYLLDALADPVTFVLRLTSPDLSDDPETDAETDLVNTTATQEDEAVPHNLNEAMKQL